MRRWKGLFILSELLLFAVNPTVGILAGAAFLFYTLVVFVSISILGTEYAASQIRKSEYQWVGANEINKKAFDITCMNLVAMTIVQIGFMALWLHTAGVFNGNLVQEVVLPFTNINIGLAGSAALMLGALVCHAVFYVLAVKYTSRIADDIRTEVHKVVYGDVLDELGFGA